MPCDRHTDPVPRPDQEEEQQRAEELPVECSCVRILLICARPREDRKQSISEARKDSHDYAESRYLHVREIAARNGQDAAYDIDDDREDLVACQRLTEEYPREQCYVYRRCVEENGCCGHAAVLDRVHVADVVQRLRNEAYQHAGDEPAPAHPEETGPASFHQQDECQHDSRRQHPEECHRAGAQSQIRQQRREEPDRSPQRACRQYH